MRGVWGTCLWCGSNASMFVHRVSHCSWTRNTKVVWMADNWQCCQRHSRNTDNDFINRANSWSICFPTPFDKVCSPETRSSAGTAAVSSKKHSRSTYCLLSPRLSSGVHPWVLSWHLLLSHEWKNPSLKSTTTHLECNLSLPVLKLKISVSL